ncbi:mitochondrial inner membrane OXA1 [Micractinium conductrix]|uniref:Mitochondrial inner membrane OXA1 n=1 Tax=Micractinium conductrix TaxID=554055 RepID=A0A2P6VC38_9CHLO|nr:mitochondrial inner membrane OXA1 [Micractinium conductrix]|eukprot:PSC71648.1 mitochondrial inner membrane OXA1 [Micractinium conductrix]
MLRQVGRLRLCTAAAAAAAEGGSAATWAPPSSAALQLVDRWQQGQGGNGGHGGFRAVQQHAGARAFSLWPGKPEEQRAAAEDLSDPAAGSFAASADLGIGSAAASEAAASAAAAAAASPVTSDLFSAAAIVAAAAGAEGDALASAADDTWLGGRLVQRLLTLVHASSGLPWWEDIMLCTLAMRLMTFPVMLGQIKNTYRLSQARPEMEALMEHLKAEQARGNQQAAQEHMQRVTAVWKKYNCHPLKSLGGMFVQMPVFIGFFTALRGFAAHKIPSLTEGGTLWFTDLTIADPTYALPALAGLSFLATIELGAADGMEGQPEATRKRMKAVMRVVALAVPFLSTTLPASVFMYWTASNIFSLVQTALIRNKAVKKVLGLPDLSKLNKAPAPLSTLGMAGGFTRGDAATQPSGEPTLRPVQTFAQRPQRKPAAKKA